MPGSRTDERYHPNFGEHVQEAFEGTGVPLLEDMADFQNGHGCELTLHASSER